MVNPSDLTFYTTLAQTSGALVGLIGAVLGARAVDWLGRLHDRRSTIEEQFRAERERLQGIAVAEIAPIYRAMFDRTLTPASVDQGIEELRAREADVASNMRSRIGHDISVLVGIRDRVSAFGKGIVPRVYGATFLVLAYFCVFGVAWPLYMLRENHETIFRFFAGGLLALVALFGWLLYEIHRASRLGWRK